MTPAALDAIARALLTTVADSMLRAVVVAGVLGAGFLLLRRRGAAVRLRAWTIVLYAALVLPLAGAIVPAWRLTVPAALAIEGWAAPSVRPASISPISSPLITAPSDAPRSISAAPRITGPIVAAAIYLTGVLVLALHIVMAWIVSRRLRLSARAITDAGLLARREAHARASALRVPPALVESARIFVPVTMSVVRPVVALPIDWRDWPAERLDAVLAHEIAHVARRDGLTQRLSLLYRAIFWCSPLSWWLHRHLSELAEQASDETALHAGIAPTTYAETVLEFFTRLREGPRRAEWLVPMARGADADAARRMELILSWKGGPNMTRSKLWILGLILVAAPVVALTASIRTSAVASVPVLPVAIAMEATRPAETAVTAIAPAVGPAVAKPEPPARSASPAQGAQPRPAPLPASTPMPAPAAQTGAQSAGQPPDDDFAKGAYEVNATDVVAPRQLHAPIPKYTANAMRAKIQGDVVVEAIIATDGTVAKARIKQSLDDVWGLDEQALIAAKQWTFTPGTYQDQPVPVRVMLNLTFRLH